LHWGQFGFEFVICRLPGKTANEKAPPPGPALEPGNPARREHYPIAHPPSEPPAGGEERWDRRGEGPVSPAAEALMMH
jgi:hypothetical protein